MRQSRTDIGAALLRVAFYRESASRKFFIQNILHIYYKTVSRPIIGKKWSVRARFAEAELPHFEAVVSKY
jgi:hypothetical protein